MMRSRRRNRFAYLVDEVARNDVGAETEMRALSIARQVARTTLTVAIGCCPVLLAGCAPAATSIELAEDAVRSNSVDVATRLASVAAGLESPIALSSTQLADVTDEVAVDDSGSPVPVGSPGLQVGFASSSTAETVTVSALIRGHGQTHSGFGGTLHSFYACGEFVADFSAQQVVVRDIDCPSWLSSWIGRSEPVSITAVVGDALDDSNW